MIAIDTNIMIYALLGLVAILSIWMIRIEVRLSKMLRGKNAKSLEDTIKTFGEEIKDLEKFRDDSIEYLKLIELRLKRSSQAVETIRFNPFKGTGSGGNQSFATAILNEKGDGVIITSLYSRDRVSVFSKPIKKFSSEFELTDEEKQVLENSRANLQNLEVPR